jgi:hypothetical protein
LAASKPIGFVIVIAIGAVGAVILFVGWVRLRRRDRDLS